MSLFTPSEIQGFYEELCDCMGNPMREDEVKARISRLRRQRLAKLNGHTYMMTFTLKPEINATQEADALQWIERNVVNVLHKPFEASVYISEEKTESGRTHWHVVGTYEKSLKKSLFKYYTKTFGHIDFSLSKNTGNENALGYISKEQVPRLLN